MLVACSLAAFASITFNFYIGKVAIRIRIAIVTAFYRKLMRTASVELESNAFNAGRIVNLMSTDVDRVVNLCPSLHAFWSLPLQLVIALYLLYQEVTAHLMLI
jgi:ATP-binding cassette subfamily C (CFTR/MRP) protein 10